MSQENQITVRGYVTAEPRFWQTTPTQTPVAEIRVGSTPRRLNRATGEWQDGETSYYTVKCWRRLAVNVKGSLRKGDMVLVRGKVVTRTWVDDQQRTRVQVEIEADTLGHDLAFGWSHFNRGAQAPWNAAQRQADGEAARQDLDGDASAPGGRPDADDSDAMDAPDIGDGPDLGGIQGGPGGDERGQDDPADPREPGMAGIDFDRLARDLEAREDVTPVF